MRPLHFPAAIPLTPSRRPPFRANSEQFDGTHASPNASRWVVRALNLLLVAFGVAGVAIHRTEASEAVIRPPTVDARTRAPSGELTHCRKLPDSWPSRFASTSVRPDGD
jgi:hypothetical protein